MELNRGAIYFITAVMMLSFLGCSSIEEHILKNQQEAFEASIAVSDAILADIEQHIGKHKDELRMILGEPSEVISPSSWKNVEYDEEWVYEKGIPFVNKQYRMFYIKGDIVAHVELGGVF